MATKTKTPPSAVAAPATPGIKKLNFSGIATGKPAAAVGPADKPVLPDPDGHISELAASIKEKTAQVEALELDKAELSSLVKQFYFANANGKAAVPKGVMCQITECQKGKEPTVVGEIYVACQNRYRAITDDAALTLAAGDKLDLFRNKFEFKIDGDLVPADCAQELVEDLQKLFAHHNASGALTAKQVSIQTKEFHEKRHREFDVAQNIELDRVCPMIVQIQTKGRAKE